MRGQSIGTTRGRPAPRVIALVLALGAAGGAAQGIEVDPAIATVAQLHGAVVAQGRSARPAGALRLASYRIEELHFAPLRVKVQGRVIETGTAWRVVAIGGPFPVRDLPAVLWIDGHPIGYGQESADLSSLSTITFDRGLLRDGATLAVSYGEHGARATLPERLALPPGALSPGRR